MTKVNADLCFTIRENIIFPLLLKSIDIEY